MTEEFFLCLAMWSNQGVLFEFSDFFEVMTGCSVLRYLCGSV